MLKQFISFINKEQWDLDPMQMAEVLWFVQQVSQQEQEEDDSQYLTAGSSEQLDKSFSRYDSQNLIADSGEQLDKSSNQSGNSQNSRVGSGISSFSSAPQYPLTQPSNKPQKTEIEQTSFPTEKLPIKLPDTGIFRNTLELSRFVKLLKQTVNSRIAQELDVNETVRISAELSTFEFPRYFPVLTPKKERWLDVALLIEDSDSMILWQSLLTEVQDFLEYLGAFRDIKPYGIKWDNDSENLQIYPFHSRSNTLSPQQLNSSNNRRLILIVSDCISPAWINDKFINILQKWETKEKLTLLNPFPERMWERTNLDYSIRLRLGNDKKENPTKKWQAIPVESWQRKYLNQETVKLPILNLERESMAAWVNVMVGKGTSWCAGAGLGSDLMFLEDEEEEEEPLTPREQINNFYATSSALAWQLIQYLSAIPVSLSTIRLVQRTLLPKSTQVNVAEVAMGGLLSPVKPFNSYQYPQEIEFEFKPGIREIFLERLGEKEFCLGVIGSLTEKIASHFGYETVREFEATLLTESWKFQGDEDIELIQTFATISVSTLRQYGKEYDAYIRKLDRSRARLNLMSGVTGESVNWIDFLENIALQYDLTSIETETLINMFPSPQESLSISEVAEKLLSSTSAISSRLTNIYRKFASKILDLFESVKHSKLPAIQSFLYSQYITPDISKAFEYYEVEIDVATIVFEEEIPPPLPSPPTLPPPILLETGTEFQEWSFETPTVDGRGKIVQSAINNAFYFTETLPDNVTLEMVAISDGTFTMGSPESEKDSNDDERPQHDVTVPPFFMGKYPITQGQWKAIASRTDLKVNLDLDPEPSRFKEPYKNIDRWQRPVEDVNWYEAVEFCQRLSILTGRKYRLPSEAEWEYACCARTTTPFYFGETITGELANYDASETYAGEANGFYRKETTPVGQFPPNAFGLYDMHGNVWEWCADDWHENYENAPTDGTAWLDHNETSNYTINDEKEKYTVLRGSSWLNYPDDCRSAIRNYIYRRDYHFNYIGFRVVCDGGSE
ncbi:formylglycine-generating enzyme family protein [Okeania sp. SIO3B5]|uniref:formylglycine-generating enzyme family protein n=1 Tax=Okeania sp. SIO3B5 TaxID=2607811 RepID=UPI0025D621F3|nr:formylglycine-generating enzyme family protein [Okeania sp. SIO3B5]